MLYTAVDGLAFVVFGVVAAFLSPPPSASHSSFFSLVILFTAFELFLFGAIVIAALAAGRADGLDDRRRQRLAATSILAFVLRYMPGVSDRQGSGFVPRDIGAASVAFSFPPRRGTGASSATPWRCGPEEA